MNKNEEEEEKEVYKFVCFVNLNTIFNPLFQ